MDEEGKRSNVLAPIGDSGLKMYGGFLSEEFLPELNGERGRRVFREMAENDATINAILEAITTLLGAAEITVAAADDSEEADDAKKFIEEELDELEVPLSDVMSEIATMFTYGFAPCEWTARRRPDGRVGLKEIALRSQTSLSRWGIDEFGNLTGMWQQATWKNLVFVPKERLALFRTRTNKNSPEGRSLMRGIYRAWYFKCRMEEIEAIGVERDLAGLPVLTLPNNYLDPNATPEEKAFLESCKRLVTQVRRENREGIVLPSDVFRDSPSVRQVELRLLTSGGGRSFNTSEIITRYDRAIATAVLADFIFLGQQSVGSFALSSDKTQLFSQAVGAYLTRIADVLNRQVIARIWELNGFDKKLMPKIKFGDVERPNLGELSSFISALVGSGAEMFPNRELQNFLHKIGGLPALPEEEGLADQGAPGGGEDDWRLASEGDDAVEKTRAAERSAHALVRLRNALRMSEAA